MYIGADYYPEHWSRERWPIDARMMREAGFNVTRLAEFAWVRMEPSEGVFDFSWLDDALAVLHKEGISALLCTPTAVMPAWMARSYPECLLTTISGKKITYGVRKDACLNSPSYKYFSARITRAMAEHFVNTPNVIGWQTDNEFGGENEGYCHCDVCRQAFRNWLMKRHGDLETLNKNLGTHFWGHQYQSPAEIQIPEANHNPSLFLEWKRFYSWQNVMFQREQVCILREVCPKHVVTHNMMGFFENINYFDLGEDLDHVSWDNYPVWGQPNIPYRAAAEADMMRGVKRKNFWIMEQSTGPSGWSAYGRNPRPGELRTISYQQLAHGADAQIWFRWRTCTAGREQYWHGLLGHDGKENRRYREAAQVAGEYHKLEKLLDGTTVKPKVAMIYDYDSVWVLKNQPGYAGATFFDAFVRWHRPLFQQGINTDVISATQDFSEYKVIIAPHLHVISDETAARLNAFVKKGGILITDCRTGVKTPTNLCHERTLPGILSESLGIRIEEYEALPEGPAPDFELSTALTGGPFHASAHADWITPESATVLAGYDESYLKPFAAATKNKYGKGYGYYVGTVVREDSFYVAIVADACGMAKIVPHVTLPEGVEASVRGNATRELLFLINHTDEEKNLVVPAGKKELLSGKKTSASLTLEARGVAVLLL